MSSNLSDSKTLEKQFLLFDHLHGFELFKIKQLEDFSVKSFEEYFSLLEAVNHVSSYKGNVLSYEWLKLSGVSILHVDRVHQSNKSTFTHHGISIFVNQCCSIFRGIRSNLHKFINKKFKNSEVLQFAHQYSKAVISKPKLDFYIINLAAEVENLKKEISLFDNPHLLSTLKCNEYSSVSTSIANKKKHLEELEAVLQEKVQSVAPNLRKVLRSDILVGKMLHKAGGISKLAVLPASTLQLLGAEKALFRSLKNNTNTPKYGNIIYESLNCFYKDEKTCPRFLGNKCSIAAKIDAYSVDSYDK